MKLVQIIANTALASRDQDVKNAILGFLNLEIPLILFVSNRTALVDV
jgi:hypothetical protein